jgi:hypothetical protein
LLDILQSFLERVERGGIVSTSERKREEIDGVRFTGVKLGRGI